MKNAERQSVHWVDLQLFLHVAREQGLSSAARRTGVSPATLGRAMTRLERWAGLPLFVRHTQGYQLTQAGAALLERAAEVELRVDAVERWRAGEAERTQIRISAGTWVSYCLVANIETLWKPDDDFSVVLLTSNDLVDISRRHADIGVRNRRPAEPWLAGRRIGPICFAPYYANKCEDASEDGANQVDWLATDETAAVTPSTRWVLERYRERIGVRTNDPRHLLDLARRGIGRAVLPCFVGDEDSELIRCGEVIDELTHDQWLVVHHDDRNRKPFRTLIERVATLLQDKAMRS